MISYLSTCRKKIASILLVIFISNIAIPMIGYSKPIPSGGNPVSDALANYVDPFTGDFSYSVPLMSISGPNGENFPISASYSGGIKMNQEASWIGLGWDFNPGEITRNVNGYPDDWKGSMASVKKTVTKNSVEEIATTNFKVYGPLYFKDFDITDTNSTMDLYQSSRLFKKGEAFEFPDYDDYNVSGFGSMRPHMFEYATLLSRRDWIPKIGTLLSNEAYDCDESNLTTSEHYYKFQNTPEFRFDNELSKFSTPKYQKAETDINQNNFKYEFFKPKEVSQFTNYDKYYKSNNNAILSTVAEKGKQVFFFTNKKINDEYNSLKTSSNFLDFRIKQEGQLARPTEDFPTDGIGAFQVVDLDGTTYHYSLPVYTMSNEYSSFIFKDQAISTTFNPYKVIDPERDFIKSSKNDKYAISWKLTAITGPDFKDVNGNGIVDDDDKGYWIKFDYGKWNNEFSWREPYYNCNASGIQNKILPPRVQYIYYKSRSSINNLYREGNFSKGITEDYYLNSIETSTQKAVFIKDIRNDSKSAPTTSNSSTIKRLKLSKIALFNKKDIAGISFKDASILLMASQFDLTGVNNVIDVYDFESLGTTNSINEKVLKQVDFTQDYSLCKGLYNNFKNTFSTEYIQRTTSSLDAYYYVNNISTPLNNQSGKLTLLEINFKEQKSVQINPSYKFDYDQEDPLKNPNYNPDQQDFWGYFKSDYNSIYRGHYTTFASSKNVDAWSLKKILTPLGAEIEVDYESDRYNSVGYDESEDFVDPNSSTIVSKNLIQRTFQIYSVEDDNSTFTTSGSAYFLDNDVFNFVLSTNEDRRNSTIVRVPLVSLDGSYLFNFECFSGGIADRPQFSYKYNTATTPSNGNKMYISRHSNCSSTDIDLTNFIYHRAGFLTQYLNSAYGGGVRVKKISIKDVKQNIPYYLNYVYNKGVASSEPDNFASMNDKNYLLAISSVGTDRHIPRSNVGYSSVDIINSGINSDFTTINAEEYIGKVTLEFFNYTKDAKTDEKYFYTQNGDPEVLSNGFKIIRGDIRNLMTIDYNINSNYGKISRKIVLDKNNNSIDLYNYEYESVPTTKEVFYKYHKHGVSDLGIALGLRTEYEVSKTCQKTDYISLLKDVIHYKNGTIVEEVLTKPEYYNVLTGQCEQILSKDISGRVTQTITTPAYVINSGSNMEPKYYANSNNKNLLNANGKTVVKVLQNSSLTDAIEPTNTTINNAVVSNWSNTASVRKYNSSTQQFYTDNNVSVPYYVNNTKSYNGKTSDALWDLNSQIALLDEDNKVLEVKNISGKRSSMKYSSMGNGVLAECKNASYTSFTFNSFEEQLELSASNYQSGGEVRIGNGEYRMEQTTNVKAHSGSFVSVIPSAQEYGANYKSTVNTTDGLTPNRTYVAKAWVHANSDPSARIFIDLVGKINGTTYTDYKEVRKDNANNLQIGQWILMSVQMNVPNNFTTTSSNEFINVGLAKNTSGAVSYFDDLIFSPIDASVTGYVVSPFTKQIDAVIGGDGLTVRYEYDALGRNTYTSKESTEGIKIISKNKYNFSR